MKILSVDDSSTMRKIISLALTGVGHTVYEAENGLQALEKLKAAPVDCIMLDINMPEMNGIEFLKARKSIASIASIPIFVLTTQDEEVLKKEAMDLGARGFIVKPFRKDALVAAIKGL